MNDVVRNEDGKMFQKYKWRMARIDPPFTCGQEWCRIYAWDGNIASKPMEHTNRLTTMYGETKNFFGIGACYVPDIPSFYKVNNIHNDNATLYKVNNGMAENLGEYDTAIKHHMEEIEQATELYARFDSFINYKQDTLWVKAKNKKFYMLPQCVDEDGYSMYVNPYNKLFTVEYKNKQLETKQLPYSNVLYVSKFASWIATLNPFFIFCDNYELLFFVNGELKEHNHGKNLCMQDIMKEYEWDIKNQLKRIHNDGLDNGDFDLKNVELYMEGMY